MHWINDMIRWHPMLLGAIAMAVGNCFVTSLPSPDDKSSKFYHWFFNFAHAVVLAVPRIMSQYKSSEPAKP